MPLFGDDLVGEAVGEVESDDGVLVLRRIHVTYKVRAPAEQREMLVDRVADLRTGLSAVLKPEALQVASSDSNLICESVGS